MAKIKPGDPRRVAFYLPASPESPESSRHRTVGSQKSRAKTSHEPEAPEQEDTEASENDGNEYEDDDATIDDPDFDDAEMDDVDMDDGEKSQQSIEDPTNLEERKCWVDINFPRIGECSKEMNLAPENRHRKIVSDFFGRNKKATASVALDYFPMLCRECYGEWKYRLEHEPRGGAARAEFHCDGILQALSLMRQRTYTGADGIEYPWWCGLELQLTSQGHQLEDDPDKLQAEVDAANKKASKAAAANKNKSSTKLTSRVHTREMPDRVPAWLLQLCTRGAADDQQHINLGERAGVVYSFEQLAQIIRAVKTYCHQRSCKFPTIEAIPITIGLLDTQILKHGKKRLAEARKRLKEMSSRAKGMRGDDAEKARVVEEVEECKARVEALEEDVKAVVEDSRVSEGTIPEVRVKSSAAVVRAVVKAPRHKVNPARAKQGMAQEESPQLGWREPTSVYGPTLQPPSPSARMKRKRGGYTRRDPADEYDGE